MRRIVVVVACVAILAAGCFPSRFESCDEAEANGAAPLLEGDDGWNPALDRDGDGVACE